jgi:hypothetical protein
MTGVIGMLAVVGGAVAAGVGARGVLRLARALRHADGDGAALDLIRGLRGVAVGIATAALVGGVSLEQRWLQVFGVVFLLEELYETAVAALILRHGEQAAAGDRAPATRRADGTPAVTPASRPPVTAGRGAPRASSTYPC